MHTIVVQKVLNLIQETWKQDHFYYFNIIPLDINALGSTMLKHSSHTTKEGGIVVLQKHLHSTYDLLMATTQVRFQFTK